MVAVVCVVSILWSCHPVEDARPPIVLITLEGNGLPSSGRALELLERHGFDRSWSAVASSANVVAALGSLHTGLRPWQHGALNDSAGLHPACETLALTLKALGYETSAFTDRGARLERLGFARGYSRYGALRSGKRALTELQTLAPASFVWLHLRFDAQRDIARQWRRLGSALEAAAQSPSWSETVVAIVGVTGSKAQGLGRDALAVPIHLRSPGGSATASAETPVAAARLYETLNALAGGEPLPATASSLLDSDASVPLLSSVHGRAAKPGGRRTNVYSLVEGDRQLLWRAEVRGGPRGLPLSGAGRPQLQLRRWGDGLPIDEPKLRDEMASRLERAWLADLDGEDPMLWRPLGAGSR